MPQPEVTEWRISAGGQIDDDSHGAVDLGVRRGAFSAELLTETLELRWAPNLARGRVWTLLRGESPAAGLVISPWTDGAPDPGRALLGSTFRVEGGAILYGPKGLYGGVSLSGTHWAFDPKSSETIVEIPADRPVGATDFVGGWWSPSTQGWVIVGVNAQPETISPHVSVTASVDPEWPVAPLVSLHAGVAEHTDIVTATRLGGLVPYTVPVAGAAWAEWWVEDYAAIRAGPQVHAGSFGVGTVADIAWFDGEWAEGFAAITTWRKDGWTAEVHVGVAPWIPRQEGIGRDSVFVRVGRDWRVLKN